MEDAARRIVLNLSDFKANTPNEPFILYTDKPYPSYLIHNKDKILGIISRVGGYTSHTAILARNYDIPFVISKEDYKEGEEVLIDTRKKIIITNPSSLQRNIKKDMKHKKAILHAGYKFLANAASDLDVKKAMEYGFDGVGLYRTEMIFMNSNRPFTALEQYKIYSDAVAALAKDKYIVFRTFDVGGDKQISYVHTNKKGIDNYKQNPYIFENQVMAILKIYTDTKMDIRIMFPMIFEPEEFDYLKG
jgi:phosphoenolpyruvate-protein kinase (PTS system EI component)